MLVEKCNTGICEMGHGTVSTGLRSDSRSSLMWVSRNPGFSPLQMCLWVVFKLFAGIKAACWDFFFFLVIIRFSQIQVDLQLARGLYGLSVHDHLKSNEKTKPGLDLSSFPRW